MSKRYMGRRILSVSVAAALALSLSACGGQNSEQEDPVAAETGGLGAYDETLVCNMGRSTIANPKFRRENSYEDNAYTRYLKEKLNVVGSRFL